ncbi:MAG TPA: FAA hydrolase family protein [Deltaproteobacteria bacterium]|nr:FAA hydrolase family protein [Deltaproteobacteria bacterium]
MKLATRRMGRDGELMVVDPGLSIARSVPEVAMTLQAVLDDWEKLAPALREVDQRLRNGLARGTRPLEFDALAAPLPRAYQWLDGSAYVNHVELVRKARGAEMPERFWTDPLMYQGGSDVMLGARDDLAAVPEDWGLDFEAEVAVILGDVPRGAGPEQCSEAIRLITLVNDVSLRGLIPDELGKGFGFLHSKPPTAFAPVAVTPDELGDAWRDGKVHLPLRVHRNGEFFGAPDAGVDMTFDFPTLIAHAAATRPLSAGTILGSGTVSNRDRSTGGCCIAEKRMLEILDEGEVKTPFLRVGETIRIEMLDADGNSIFGAIEQQVVASVADPPRTDAPGTETRA